jgi:hypothetical protein
MLINTNGTYPAGGRRYKPEAFHLVSRIKFRDSENLRISNQQCQLTRIQSSQYRKGAFHCGNNLKDLKHLRGVASSDSAVCISISDQENTSARY